MNLEKNALQCTACGTRLFLEVLFISLSSSSCNLNVALAAMQLLYSPPAGGISKKTCNETLETS